MSGADSRAEFQAALNSGLLDLRAAPGRWYVDIPPSPRPIPILTMPNGARILGRGAGDTEIVFRGNPEGHDLACIRPGDDYLIDGVRFVVEEPGGVWNEQSHIIEVVGPRRGGEIRYCSFSHPVVAGSKRGDCIRFRGYPPAEDGSADKRIWDQHVHHTVFEHAARSGIAMYGGVNASMFDHLTFLDVSDQDLDQEGTAGGNFIEWCHNVHRTGPSASSSLAVSIYPGSTHFHHNTLDGRGLDVMGGSSHIHHNAITQRYPTSDPVAYFRKQPGSHHVHDETWVRASAAGPSAVFGVAEKLTSPHDFMIEDSAIVQYTGQIIGGVTGVRGITMQGVTMGYLGPQTNRPRDAFRIEGTATTRTIGVKILDCEFNGPFRAAVSASGSYLGGVGDIEVRDCVALGAQSMMFLENMAQTPTMGGIAGPIIDIDNRDARSVTP